jgi:nitrogen fixation NifU-like protein
MTDQTDTGNWDRIRAVLLEAIQEQQEAMFSATVLQEARQPRNMGLMLNPDGFSLLTGTCGDTMEFFLRIRDSRIDTVTFMTDGCGPTVACGSRLTRMAKGQDLEEAAAIEAEDLIHALDGLPPEHTHCATLAVETLRDAIADHWRQEVQGEKVS